MVALVPQDATPEQARELTDRIKVAVDGTWQLVAQAYEVRAWVALGYRSWDDYTIREFGTSRLRLPREERQEVVASLREIGMSVRAIASATGDSVGAVHDVIAGVQDRTPAESDEESQSVTGVDGKTYSSSRTAPASTARPPLPARFATAVAGLSSAVARVEQLTLDDRFAANRTSISERCLPEVRRAAEVLSALAADLT